MQIFVVDLALQRQKDEGPVLLGGQAQPPGSARSCSPHQDVA
jgi:hypothetical protein